MLEKDPLVRIDPKSALQHSFFKTLEYPFEEELDIPEDTPTHIEETLKKFSPE